jgi:2,3-bisphosphoglycerate-dependent phosphoglycerate mutase
MKSIDINSSLKKIIENNKIDRIYTSVLFRNMRTVEKLFEDTDRYPVFVHIDKGRMKEWGFFEKEGSKEFLVFVTEKLNERYYGKLQGLNKEMLVKRYGKEKVLLWRRSYDMAPPGGESLKDVYKRVVPFFKKNIEKDLENNLNVLVVSSHNSLRAIVKYIENISKDDILKVELDYGSLVVYNYKNKKYDKQK